MASETTRRSLHSRVSKLSRKGRLAILAAAAFGALALSPVAFASAEEPAAAPQDVSIMAPSYKAPFDCNKTFNANNWSPGHNPSNSIDWQNASETINGKNVRASAGGTATFYDRGNTSYGKYVVINHGNGASTLYAHLSSMVRSPGQTMSVSQGTKIGAVGSTGNSSAPHLHYEQRVNGSVQSPVVEGISVPLGSKKAIKSSNGCSGGGNPYTPTQVCGSGFSVINQHDLGSAATIYLLYNSSNKNNCVVTMKKTNLGSATAVSATLQVQGKSKKTDSGNFSYYAGPVKDVAAATCVKWGGSVGSTSWESPYQHCG
ncbi:peptidase M23-like protein [Stackebrandtia endophytica]|uniref:Peptidase M23-like protein n=1 Tax=Stackebrandtia endophytica TaxID=1496996 RepID=A0A543ATT9_9ACTN|nr:M23 family metallopeptidase [Stackebrandtia endophytica]TQL75979.1 peptidase M23-like protein [Stackebrandtia endophytica]